jgi:hypothetical protein
MDPDEEAVYLIHTRELHALQKLIYKIGRSHHIHSRIKHYPKGSKIICILNCENSIFCEKELIKIFKEKFNQRKDYGTEYFEGDKKLMIREIFKFIDNQNSIMENVVVGNVDDMENVVADIENIVSVDDVIVEKKEEKIEMKKKNDKINVNNDINPVNGILKDRTCPKCKHVFNYPSILKMHFRNSFHCLLNEEEINIFNNKVHNIGNINNANIIKCNKCKVIFTTNSSLFRHNRQSKCGKSN